MRAEVQLGLLGWQQAEFDEETQREVDQIQKFESAQARLSNESAALAKALTALAEQRATAQAAFTEKRSAHDAAVRTEREAGAHIESEIAAARGQAPALEARVPELERELREVTRIYQELLKVEEQTPLVRDDQARVRERTVAIPGEIGELQTRRARIDAEVEALTRSLEQTRSRETDAKAALAKLNSEHEDWDRVMQNEIKIKEREKAWIEKESDALEGAKTNPYQRIGQVLADNHLAPMNQPQALEAVRAARLRIQELEYDVAKSHADSEREDRTLVQHSLILWGSIALALALVLGALIEW